jgi:energy-coupling factor transport system substrate-specific component
MAHNQTVQILSSFTIFLSSVIGFIAFTWPLYVIAENDGAARWLFLTLVPLVTLITIVEITTGSLNVKSLAFLGVLSATGAALRAIGAGAVGLEPIWFLIIIGGRAHGKRFGFILGLTTLLASAILTGGVGPWLAFQMMCAAWIGWGAGALPRIQSKNIEVIALAGYGIFAAAFFGFMMDLQLWPWIASPATTIAYIPGDAVVNNLERFVAFHFATALAWDIPRAVFNAVLILLLGRALLNSIRRAMQRGNVVINRGRVM